MPAAVSSITRQTVGRTFIVAITILGIGAMAQLGAIAWLFFARFHVGPQSSSAAAGAANSASGQNREFADPFADAALPSATATPAATPPPAPPKPMPISQQALNHPNVTTEPSQADRLNELLEQGRLLRDRGDTYAAVTKLREAQVIDSSNPAPLAELAYTYEKMGFNEKAAETWKRIYDMGDAAGVYYAAAEGKLNASKAQMLRQVQVAPPDSPSESSSPASETVGLGPASKFGFATVTRTDENDPQLLQKITLHVGVKAKPRARVDAADLTIKVVMYDLVSGNKLDVNKANVHYQWAASPADWSERDVETLDVTYARPRPAQGEPMEERKYYGYIASIYYKNVLQDSRSDPPRLAQQAPPPHTLSE